MDDLVYNERTGEFESVGTARKAGHTALSVCRTIGAVLCGAALIGTTGLEKALPYVKSWLETCHGKLKGN